MFATLLGPLPRPPLGPDASRRALVEAVVRAQETAGIEPVTDGGLPGASDPVAAWERTAGLTERAVKQALRGPYSLAWSTEANAAEREAATLAHAEAGNAILRALAAAGCPLIEVHEPSATAIGAAAAERALFREAHLRLLDGVEGTHLSLAITGGSADAAGIDTILGAPYASLAVDLIAGPDNWRLVADAPGEIGIVCGALSPAADGDDGPEVLLWAVAYAASTGARGSDRVGLATASSLAGLLWPDAMRKIERLGAAARLAEVPASEAVSSLDPRAVSSRAAALGYAGQGPSRGPRPDHDPT
jgi:hypothetical protein